jgi:hypothetical protein
MLLLPIKKTHTHRHTSVSDAVSRRKLKVKAQRHTQNTSSNKWNTTTTLQSRATKPTLRPANDYRMLNHLYSLLNAHEVKQFIHNIEFWLNSIPSGLYIVAWLQYKYTYMTSYEILKGGGGINMNAASRGRGRGGCITRSMKFNEADMRAFV